MTESKIITGYFLTKREDLLINACFCTILAQNQYLEIKLATKFEDSRFRNWLHFGNLLEFELKKTRKHWILVGLELKYRLEVESWPYFRFETLAEMDKILTKHLHLDQDCTILKLVYQKLYVLSKLDSIKVKAFLEKFEQDLMQEMGFR